MKGVEKPLLAFHFLVLIETNWFCIQAGSFWSMSFSNRADLILCRKFIGFVIAKIYAVGMVCNFSVPACCSFANNSAGFCVLLPFYIIRNYNIHSACFTGLNEFRVILTH